MQEETTIQITFSSEELLFYKIIQQHCINKKISITDYIKEVIKKDLAWGQFAKRKNPGDKKKNNQRYGRFKR